MQIAILIFITNCLGGCTGKGQACNLAGCT